MSSDRKTDLAKDQDFADNEKVAPKNFTDQKEIKSEDEFLSIEAKKKVNGTTDVEIKEEKAGSCDQIVYPVSPVRAVNKCNYSSITKPCETETSAQAGSEGDIDKKIKTDTKTQLPGELENLIYSREDFESRDSDSDTEKHSAMGSLICSSAQNESKLGKSYENSHDPSDSKEQQPGAKKKMQGTSKDPKKYKQTTLHFFENKEKATNGRKHKQAIVNSSESQEQTKYSKIHQESTIHTSRSQDRASWRKESEKSENIKHHKRFTDRDTENYRNRYPGKEDSPDLNDNVRFYRGEIMSTPKGAYIDEIHKKWWGDFDLLERHHGYIQWLFPIRESGMNMKAQPLQLHEAKEIKADPEMKKRFLKSYQLMLDFYGMKLQNERTGQLVRSENWRRCFQNLNKSSHNYLRITRILKCLGELGYEHLKKGLIQFVLKEGLVHHTLDRTLTSCRDYWIGTIRDDKDREDLYRYMDEHKDVVTDS